MEILDAEPVRDAPGEVARAQELLDEVAAGHRAAVARVLVPSATVAFGRLDELLDGYAEARRRAAGLGFAPVRRLAGGRATAYHSGSVVVEVYTPQAAVVGAVEPRFEQLAHVIVAALATVGIEAAVGELAGEFCPGRFSIHAGGIKLAGIAQRSRRGAALTGAFVSVQRGAALREVLAAVYDALGLPLDSATAGAAEDLRPGIAAAEVAAALESKLRALRAVA